MRLGGWLHRPLAWLALCAMVFGAFAPSVSKLLAASQGVSWTEVCSTQGTRWITVDTGVPDSPQGPVMPDDSCGYCMLQQHAPFAPSASLTWDMVVISSGRLSLGSGGTTVFKRFIREAHRTRAPPLLA